MKKVNALVIGIVFLFAAFSPLTSAFADSDPGLSSAVWSNTFGWYTGFPMVDSNGYMDLNDWTITYVSNGQASSNPGSGDVVYLYQPGDYVEYSFNGYDLLSNYHSSIRGIPFGQNPYYSSGGLADLKYILQQSNNSSDAFYKYIRGFQYDNREIDWAHIIFSYPGTGITKIRIEYDGSPAIWNCIYIKFNGWRNSPVDTSLTTGDMITLQNNIISAFNAARIADLLELQINSDDIDLSTLEATTASILQKLADVPDIVPLLTTISTTDTSILSGVHDILTYYSNMFHDRNFVALNPSVYDGNGNPATNSQSVSDGYYVVQFDNRFRDKFLQIQLEFYASKPTSTFTIDYYFINDLTKLIDNRTIHTPAPYEIVNLRTSYVKLIFDVLPYQYTYQMKYLVFHIHTDEGYIALYPQYSDLAEYYSYIAVPYKYSFFDRILYYLKNLAFGYQSVPSGIQQTTDTVTEQVTDIVEFEDTYNQSLESSATQIDVSSYEIQQTQGMSFMRTYTELNFDRMQNFRILFLTPLILALAAFFLRRKT